MRTSFVYVGLSCLMAVVGSSGCSDIHVGQKSDPPGPNKLFRIMVQNVTNKKGVAYDLLDTRDSLLTIAVPCDDINPCSPHFLLNQDTPDFSCDAMTQRCKDPLQVPPGGIVVPPPAMMNDAPTVWNIRLVFEKILDRTMETATSGAATAPPFALNAGILQFTAGGAPVAGNAYIDNSGPPRETSDPILIPYGPAIVFQTTSSLAKDTTFTLALNGDSVRDQAGTSGIADQLGNSLPGMRTYTFKTAP